MLALVAVAAVLILLPAAAAATAPTPTVTIVGPGYISQDPMPTEPAPTVNESYVTLYLDDDGWGADYVRFSNDGGVTWQEGEQLQTYMNWSLFRDLDLPLDGLCTVTAQFSADGGASWGPTASATTLVDEQSPSLMAPAGYWNNHYRYRLYARDQIGLSGVRYLWYRVDAGQLTTVANTEPLGTTVPLKASFPLAGQTGTRHSIDFIAADYAGNYSGMRRAFASKAATGARAAVRRKDIGVITTSVYIVIDRTAPIVKARGGGASRQRGPVAVSFSARDRGGAGVDCIQYSVTRAGAKRPAAWTTGNSVLVTRRGASRVWYRAVDKALPKGNASSAQSVIVRIF